jgi:hypothetical protein
VAQRQPARRLEGKHTNHLRRAEVEVRTFRAVDSGKRAGTHPFAEAHIGYGDAFVEPFTSSSLEAGTIMAVDFYDLREV